MEEKGKLHKKTSWFLDDLCNLLAVALRLMAWIPGPCTNDTKRQWLRQSYKRKQENRSEHHKESNALSSAVTLILTRTLTLQGFAMVQTCQHNWHLLVIVVDLSVQRKKTDNYTSSLFISRLQCRHDLTYLPW